METINWSSFRTALVAAWIAIGCTTAHITALCTFLLTMPSLRTSPVINLIANDATDWTAPSCPSTAHIFNVSTTAFLAILATRESLFSRTLSRLGRLSSLLLPTGPRDLHLYFPGWYFSSRRCPSQLALSQPLQFVGRYQPFVNSAWVGFRSCTLG